MKQFDGLTGCHIEWRKKLFMPLRTCTSSHTRMDDIKTIFLDINPVLIHQCL